MKKFVTVVLLSMILVGSAFAMTTIPPNTPHAVELQHAMDGARMLPTMMKDPDSFVLEGVYEGTRIDKKHPERLDTVCYTFRSHNAMGGYTGGEAYLNWKGQVSIFPPDEWVGAAFICNLHHMTDITAQIKAWMAAPEPLTRADRTKWLEEFNAEAQKNGVPLYGEITEDTLTVHSERASDIRWHAMLLNKPFMDAIQQLELTTLVYTNDKDFNQSSVIQQ